MNAKGKPYFIAGAILGIAMAIASLAGMNTHSTALILLRKALVSLSFILIGIGFVYHEQRKWKSIGYAVVVVNALALLFWASALWR